MPINFKFIKLKMFPTDFRLSPRRPALTKALLVINSVYLRSVQLSDLSEGGAGVIVDQAFLPSTNGHITLRLTHHQKSYLIQARLKVVTCRAINEGQFQLGLQFTRFMQSTASARRLLGEWENPNLESSPGTERRKSSQIELVIEMKRRLVEIMSSPDRRARSSASGVMQTLYQMEAAIPKRRSEDGAC